MDSAAHNMDSAAHGWEGNGGLVAVEGAECSCDGHSAVTKAVAGAMAVAAADWIPVVANLVSGKANRWCGWGALGV